MINAGFHVRVDSARVSLGFSKAVSWYCWTIARLIAPPPSKQIVLSYHFTQQAYANNIIFASKASFQDMRLIFQGNLFYDMESWVLCCQVATSPPRPASPCFTSRGPWWCWIGCWETWELYFIMCYSVCSLPTFGIPLRLNYSDNMSWDGGHIRP